MTVWGPGSLLPLAPGGCGTSWAEGLASYLARLAGAHVLPTNVLVSRVLPEVLGVVSGRNVLSGRRGAWMNGNGKWARELSSVLERLTLQPGLDRLTMLPWRHVLPAPRVLAPRRRWCRHCYRAMREETGGCWDPLVWSLAPVEWCTVHGERLCFICPVCDRNQPWLPRDTSLGWCAWCGADLVDGEGQGAGSENFDPESVRVPERWAAGVCTDMVAAVGQGNVPARPRQVGERIRSLLFLLDEGNQSAFARRFGVSLPTPRHWMRTGVVRLDCLLRLCWYSGLHPLDLVLKDRPFDDTLRSLVQRAAG